MLWFDNHLLQKGEAYSNQTGSLYYFDDSRLPEPYKVYASSHKQWVNDSSIVGETNPVIPTSFNGYSRADGLDVSILKTGGLLKLAGYLIANESFNWGLLRLKTLTCTLPTKLKTILILENKFELNSRYQPITPDAVDPYDQVLPAIFYELANT